MASKEKFRFEDPETGEKIFECGVRQGALNRAKLYLFKGADPHGTTETNLWLALWGFLSAKAAGHPVVELPEPRKITAEKVCDLMDEVTVYYDVDTEDAGAPEDGTENPTVTSAEPLSL